MDWIMWLFFIAFISLFFFIGKRENDLIKLTKELEKDKELNAKAIEENPTIQQTKIISLTGVITNKFLSTDEELNLSIQAEYREEKLDFEYEIFDSELDDLFMVQVGDSVTLTVVLISPTLKVGVPVPDTKDLQLLKVYSLKGDK